MRSLSIYGLAITLVALTGCGGGGGGDSASTPEGFWQSEKSIAALLVTSNNEVWGIEVDGNLIGAHKGTVSAKDGSFTAGGYSYANGTRVTVQTAGTFKERQSINGTSTSPDIPGWTSSFALIYQSGYEDSPKSLVGAYTLYTEVGTATGSFTVNSDGALVGTSKGCGFAGTALPDSTGKNFYRLNFQFSQSQNCAVPGANANGVLVYDANENSGVFVGTTSDANIGMGGAFVKQ